MSDLTGTIISDRYELTSLVGQGGQGAVYRAEDRLEQRTVAVKVLPIAATNKELSARLAREQEAMLALAGTSAVAVYDLCEGPKGALCLVMEFLEGQDLEKHLEDLEDRGDRLPLPRLSAIAEPLVDTLERAHEAGIVHRDLKPANIFLLSDNAGGGVRLLDFGLSRMKSAMPLTAAGTIVGSPSYIAPEVWKGSTADLDRRADVYSFAVILFRALAGRLPFTGESLQEKFMAATTARRPSLHALRPDLPKRVDAWTETALAIERDQRYGSVRLLWTDLLSALNYSPAPNAIRPVAQGLVSAWRKATHAFRRFVATEERPSNVPTLPENDASGAVSEPRQAVGPQVPGPEPKRAVESPVLVQEPKRAVTEPRVPAPEQRPRVAEPQLSPTIPQRVPPASPLPVVPPPPVGLPAVPPPPAPRTAATRAPDPTTDVDDTQKTLFWNKPPVVIPEVSNAPTIAAAEEAFEAPPNPQAKPSRSSRDSAAPAKRAKTAAKRPKVARKAKKPASKKKR